MWAHLTDRKGFVKIIEIPEYTPVIHIPVYNRFTMSTREKDFDKPIVQDMEFDIVDRTKAPLFYYKER